MEHSLLVGDDIEGSKMIAMVVINGVFRARGLHDRGYPGIACKNMLAVYVVVAYVVVVVYVHHFAGIAFLDDTFTRVVVFIACRSFGTLRSREPVLLVPVTLHH